MHHLYPSLKGDQLCPLGFHPQTRYPTRCKRCFRDYKEHGARRGIDDVAASSPNLSDGYNSRPASRTWTSTQNLSTANGSSSDIELKKRPQSWASTPDVDEMEAGAQTRSATQPASRDEEHNVDVTVKLPVPPRRHTTILDLKEVENSLSQSRSSPSPSKPSSSPSRNIPDELIILSTDSLAERVRKMSLLKKQRSLNSRESSRERDNGEAESKPGPDRPERSKSSTSIAELKRSSLPPKKVTTTTSSATSISTASNSSTSNTRPMTVPTTMSTISETKSLVSTNKSSTSKNLSSSSTVTKTTSSSAASTNVMTNQKSVSERLRTVENVRTTDVALQEQLINLRGELEVMKLRAERAERDKSDILLRRLASMDTASNRTAASEALMLQQKVNELKEQLEKISEDKRKLNVRMKELENKGSEYDLKRKLQAAEQICEELMEENQESKKEIMNLQVEMDELQDTFREDEVKSKTNLQKDLEKTTKNCRILSFKLKKSERKIEMLEQEKQSGGSNDLTVKIKKLEEELRFSNELTKKLQTEAEELRNPGKKKAPMLGVLGKSTSADGKITRESLTRGGSQEDPQQLQRDLQDSVERESDLKDQLKFAEEEAENLRKKVARFEDENDSLMMQLKKMATRSRTRKLSPTPRSRLTSQAQIDRDEGISDEDDPAELRILLELNEQEASNLRLKVDVLEKESAESKRQFKELQAKLRQDTNGGSKSLLSFGTSTNATDKKLKALNDELVQLRKSVTEKDRTLERLQTELAAKRGNSTPQDVSIDTKLQLAIVEQEAATLRSKISSLQAMNEKIVKENKRNQLELLRKNGSAEKSSTNSELTKLKDTLANVEHERDELSSKLQRMQLDVNKKLPLRSPKQVTDLTPKNHLKRWVEELEDEVNEMRVLVVSSGAEKLKVLEMEKHDLAEQLHQYKQKLTQVEGETQRLKTLTSTTQKISEMEQKLKKSDEDAKKLNSKLKEMEEKIKKQDSQIKQTESTKSTLETQTKCDKEKISAIEKDYEKEHKERERLEARITQLDTELSNVRKSAEKTKSSLEKEVKELKSKSNSSKSDSKQVQDLKKQMDELQSTLQEEQKRYDALNTHWEKLSEETILMRAQLTTEKQNLQSELNTVKQKLSDMDTIRIERTDFAKKLNDAQKKILEMEAKTLKTGNSSEYERTVLKNKLAEKEHEYERLRRENEMNVDLVFQLRKDNDDLNSKLSDYNRIEQAQSSLNGHSARMDAEIRELKSQLQQSELQLKSEVASTRLRYEQQVKNLSAELTSMQRQCERFKKDRDVLKQLLESAQKKIGDLKANTAGRQSRGSMHSSDDDDKSKIAYLEQQVGSLEDQLVDARLDVSKVKTELVSERSANEIKISEMQSKLNEFEEERVIGSGRKIPGMKTKLELSWQKEREDQQRLLQETSTLARDLRQTLFEVERERDKERLEAKRRLEQTKRSTEEEMEEGRKKIAELQCDLLELRDVHAKLRTSNEKLRRERERYEKELVKRRMEQDGGERKVGALLQTVDELVKIAPDLKMVSSGSSSRSATTYNDNTLRPEQTSSPRRSRSPSPSLSNTQISSVLARLAEASEELRKFQRINEDENERTRMRRGNLRRAASQENDASSVASNASGSQRNGSRLSRSSASNGSLIRKSLSLDHSIQKEQTIWRQDDGSVSSMQSIDSELGGLVRDSSMDSRLDSRLSGGSTQSDIPRGPRKKKKSLMGKLRSLTKSSRNSESEISIQGSDSDISVASDMRASKKDLRGRLSGMFKRSGSASRSASTERMGVGSEQRPVAVTVVGDVDGPGPREPPPVDSLTSKPIRSIAKPPTTPTTRRRLAK